MKYQYQCFRTVLSANMWQKLELEPEPKLLPKSEPEPKINNFGSATTGFNANDSQSFTVNILQHNLININCANCCRCCGIFNAVGTFDWVGAALAVAEVPQELVDTIVAEGAGQGGELHFLVTEKDKKYLFIQKQNGGEQDIEKPREGGIFCYSWRQCCGVGTFWQEPGPGTEENLNDILFVCSNID